MKTLLLLRHGQAEKQATGSDRERALTERGARDVAASARQIRAAVGLPDAIHASDARRASETATLVAAALDVTAAVQADGAIYAAGADALLALVRGLPDTADCVLLVGHNPGFEELAGLLAEAGTPPLALPTAGVAHLTFAVTRWREMRPGSGRLQGIYRPRDSPEP